MNETNNVGLDADNYEDASEAEQSDLDDDEDPNTKFHYIITESDEYGEEIPKFTKLKVQYLKRIQFSIKDHSRQHFVSTK